MQSNYNKKYGFYNSLYGFYNSLYGLPSLWYNKKYVVEE